MASMPSSASRTRQWGYRTPQHKHPAASPSGAGACTKYSPTHFMRVISFGEVNSTPGKHQPVVTIAEFDRVQAMLGRPKQKKPSGPHLLPTEVSFAAAPADCNSRQNTRSIATARRYIYYHCTRVHRTPRCRQPSIEAKELERQVRCRSCLRIHASDSLHRGACGN